MNKILFILSSILLTACVKTLEVKRDKAQVIPTNAAQLQALLDDVNTMNNGLPAAGEIASDNLLLTAANWEATPSLTDRNLYTWQQDVFNDNDYNDWTWPYQWVLNANIVLDVIDEVDATNPAERDAVKGAALFYRALAFHSLSGVFGQPYRKEDAATALGIVLRLTPGYSDASHRATVLQSYQQVLSDLQEAVTLLPVQASYKTRPSRPAACGLLARVYLDMANYEAAAAWADSCLALNNNLLDYNTLNPVEPNPFPLFNREVLFHNRLIGHAILSEPYGGVDSLLYRSYHDNDLRKSLFFKKAEGGGQVFRGSYDGSGNLFGGIATDEIYLVKAEATARLGNTIGAMETLNNLLVLRYKRGSFEPLVAETPDQALSLILEERRKELLFRGLRWPDLRRLNALEGQELILRRVLNGKVFLLQPADPRYAIPIPEKVIRLSGIPQNPK